MRRTPEPLRLVVLCSAMLAACGDRAGPAAEVVERDSAGIRIVENPAAPPAATWTLSPPRLAIGGMDAGAGHELFNATHALRLDDGRIVVANRGTHELRFYDPAGAHIRSVGRRGGGPGEYQSMWGLVRLPGDSLGVWDWTHRRLTIYDRDGELGRAVTLADVGGFAPRLLGAFDDGSFVVRRGFEPSAFITGGTGLRHDSVTLLRLGLRDAAILDTLGPFPGVDSFVRGDASGFRVEPVPFGRSEHIAVRGAHLYLGDDRAYAVHVLDRDGRTVRSIRRAHRPQPVTEPDIQRYRRETLAGIPEERRQAMIESLETRPAAAALPSFDTLFVDRLGRIWLREFSRDTDGPRLWSVLDPDGRLLARVALPPRARPLDAGQGYVLAHAVDDLDVEVVTLHSID